MENSKEEDEKVPPEPLGWGISQVDAVEGRNMQNAWLVEGVGGTASFQLPRRMSELHPRKDCCQAPPAPLCLLWKKFMPPASSIYACRDIHEIPLEKMVADAWALQHWAEKTNLPAGGKPCLLAESVKELREELKCYLSFSNEEVFKGLALPEETSAALVEEAWRQCLPVHLRGEQAWGQPRNQPWRRELLSSLDGKRFYTHHDLWWPLDRSPIHQEVQGWGKNEWYGSPIPNHPGPWPPCRKLPPHWNLPCQYKDWR